jgi:hemerythrin
LFTWKDSFSVNVSQIDNQHKKLFELGNKVYELVALGDYYDHYDEIMDILRELKEYTIYHFSKEEALLKKYNYDETDFIKHKDEHTYFIEKISNINIYELDEDQLKFLTDALGIIAEWITSHILFTDKKYSSFLSTNINNEFQKN